MIPIDQTDLHDPDNGVVGNCFIACVASIMEFPLQVCAGVHEDVGIYQWFR